MLPVAPQSLLLYVGVMSALAATPGPANVFAIATGASRGASAAVSAVLGMSSATLVWFAAAALGLAALVAAFPLAFKGLAIVGALYVGWLGVRALWAGAAGDGYAGADGRAARGSAYLAGFATQIANPKALLFFVAVLPPFIDPTRPTGSQLAVFAAITLVLDGVAMSAYGLSGAALQRAFAQSSFRRGFSIFVGLLLIAAALMILLR